MEGQEEMEDVAGGENEYMQEGEANSFYFQINKIFEFSYDVNFPFIFFLRSLRQLYTQNAELGWSSLALLC